MRPKAGTYLNGGVIMVGLGTRQVEHMVIIVLGMPLVELSNVPGVFVL